MKNYILKSIILILFVSAFTSCSNNDDQEPFEPITINLVGLDIDENDTSFTQQGFDFTAVRLVSNSSGNFQGVELSFPQNGEPSSLTLDISSLSGLTKITASIADQGSGIIDLMRDGDVVESINVNAGGSFQFREFVFDEIIGRDIDAFRYRSFEGIIESIRLE